MRVFMLGWEFPPFISGGLGMACYGLSKAMAGLGIRLTFVLPRASATSQADHIEFLSNEGVSVEELAELRKIDFQMVMSPLRPYAYPVTRDRPWKICASHEMGECYRVDSRHPRCMNQFEGYCGDIFEDVYRYSVQVMEVAGKQRFDIVHAHDWMTYSAGIAVAEASHAPLAVHVHSTEFDRGGDHINQKICDIEYRGMHSANKIIAVSGYTKNIIVDRYKVQPAKVAVVYNGVENGYDTESSSMSPQALPPRSDSIVLYLGRITMQKGPEYFLAAAKKVLGKIPNVRFVVAGDGDMMHRIVRLAAKIGIGHKVSFTGFLRRGDVDRIYRMADLYVMPSVSEPFGIAALEALSHRVPILISRQSGVAEVLTHALKVDFWDVNQMANKIAAVLKYNPLRKTLCENGYKEVQEFNWNNAAVKTMRVYETMLCEKQLLPA